MSVFLLFILLWMPAPMPTTKPINGNSKAVVPTEVDSVGTKLTPGAIHTSSDSTLIHTTTHSELGQAEKTESTQQLNSWVILMIIISCGLLGGYWNYLRTVEALTTDTTIAITDITERQNLYLKTCLLGGIVAGGIVPFLLISTSSSLLNAPSTYHYFVFGAYCLAAAVSSAAFIEAAAGSINKRLQTDLKQARQALATTTAQTVKLQDKTKKLESIAVTIQAIQRLATPLGAISVEYNQKMQNLEEQLDDIRSVNIV